MNLTNERAVGLEQKEELKVKLVKPLTKLQLLEDTSDKKSFDFSEAEITNNHNHKLLQAHAKEYKHVTTLTDSVVQS